MLKRKPLTELFPPECFDAACRVTRYIGPYRDSLEQRTYRLETGCVRLPYRLYFDPIGWALPEEVRGVYACLGLLHHDGYVREKQLRTLLTLPSQPWMAPFLLEISGGYVKELLEVLDEARRDQDNEVLQDLCRRNPERTQRAYSRMVSYWDAYYRQDSLCPCVRDGRQGLRADLKAYVGYALFRDCWGVSPRGRSRT